MLVNLPEKSRDAGLDLAIIGRRPQQRVQHFTSVRAQPGLFLQHVDQLVIINPDALRLHGRGVFAEPAVPFHHSFTRAPRQRLVEDVAQLSLGLCRVHADHRSPSRHQQRNAARVVGSGSDGSRLHMALLVLLVFVVPLRSRVRPQDRRLRLQGLGVKLARTASHGSFLLLRDADR